MPYKLYILLVLSFCLMALLPSAIAQPDINFTSLTTHDGLSSNSVNAILKDRYGLMWFATEDGLNKYDGTRFTIYRHIPDDSASLTTNEILYLHEDNAGNLWIGTGGGSLSLYNRQKDAFTNFPAGTGPHALGNNVIKGICSDYLGNVWVAHYAGINIIEPATGRITHFPSAPRQVLPKTCICVFEDSQHNMWIGTNEGLFVYNRSSNSLNRFSHKENDPASLCGNVVHVITEDRYGNMWVGTTNGLSMLPPGKKDFVNYRQDGTAANKLSNNVVNALAPAADNQLWIGTSNGLDILDIRTGEIVHLQSDLRNVQSLSYNGVDAIYIDKQGIYWVGTYQGGINKYDKNLNLFHLVQGNPLDEQGLHGKIVNTLVEDSSGQIFVGAEYGGISLFNPVTKSLHHVNLQLKQQQPGSQLSVAAIIPGSGKQLLIGTYTQGLFVLNATTGSYQQLLQANKPEALNSNNIVCLMKDHLGNCWVGTNGKGLNVLDKSIRVIFRLCPQPAFPSDIQLPINGYIRDIVEDKKGHIWVASHGDGIAEYNPGTRQFRVFNTRNSNLPSDKVQTLLEDSRGHIWVGTLGGGLCLLNRQTGQFRIFAEKEGLQNSNVRTIVEDKNGTIWVSTNQGLSSLDVATGKINNYNYNNGVQHNNFTRGAGLCASNGSLYFGGTEGFNYFNPEHLIKNRNVPAVLITDLKISNQTISPLGDGPIKENISIAKEINLDYKQNFTLSYVGLNYTAPEQNQYAYKLVGFDKDWNYVGSTTTASYTNLDPGEYTFRVMASNNDDIWNKEGASIRIFVHPPFWRTTYAYIFYLLVIGLMLFYIRHRGIKRIEQKFAQEQQKIVAEQEQKEREQAHELDQLKIKFLTNLSHEFRTPISLILGPVDNLIAEGKSERQTGQLQLIKRNGKRLLNLVNQLLDFRKMEEHELQLQPSDCEFISFVKEASDAFKDLAEKKKIKFEFTSSIEQLPTRFDQDKVERIVFNLLSNAFKFTLKGGTINLKIDKNDRRSTENVIWVCLLVKDTGIGIPSDQKAKIFDRFFQHATAGAVLNQGTGIGLSITKEFVELHGGSIAVVSEPGQGTTFTVQLPLVLLPAPASEEVQPVETSLDNAAEGSPEMLPDAEPVPETNAIQFSSILLVEDDEDFRFYLKDNLQQYKVYEAANGKEGWQKALALHPQLIVSDVSMPYMDGIELCKKLKGDKRTAHIPIILLTALTAEGDQLKGLETGANDYITKPFNFEVLNAKVKNLLVLNHTLKSTYTKQIKVLAPEIRIESGNEKLMENIMHYLEENLTNSQLSVEELSRYVGMSRSSLYSKLLELTGQTPVEFIRSVKLEKAAVLLEKSDMTIAQVAYSVGFSTPNYFAKSFKAKFGMLPSEYVQKRDMTKSTFKRHDGNKD